jgi:hypothetical protein
MLFLLEKQQNNSKNFTEGWGETAKSRRGATTPEHVLVGA